MASEKALPVRFWQLPQWHMKTIGLYNEPNGAYLPSVLY
jgi:hypothetical protein